MNSEKLVMSFVNKVSSEKDLYYELLSQDIKKEIIKRVLDAYNDGADSEHSIAEITKVDAWTVKTILDSAVKHKVIQSGKVVKKAVSPPGWGGTVEEMKKKEDIDNPFSLAWWMYNKGYESHYKEKKKKKK